MEGAPGEQFLLERLRKIEALPPSERPYDAARFLECYRLQEEVAAALPFPEEVGEFGQHILACAGLLLRRLSVPGSLLLLNHMEAVCGR